MIVLQVSASFIFPLFGTHNSPYKLSPFPVLSWNRVLWGSSNSIYLNISSWLIVKAQLNKCKLLIIDLCSNSKGLFLPITFNNTLTFKKNSIPSPFIHYLLILWPCCPCQSTSRNVKPVFWPFTYCQRTSLVINVSQPRYLIRLPIIASHYCAFPTVGLCFTLTWISIIYYLPGKC